MTKKLKRPCVVDIDECLPDKKLVKKKKSSVNSLLNYRVTLQINDLAENMRQS